LSGLENVSDINGFLKIEYNDLLSNINGIGSINLDSVNSLYLKNNPQLSTCAVQSICSYIESAVGNVSISGNAPNCNSPEEVELAYETIDVPLNISKPEISIYPNPAEKKIFISGLEEFENMKVNIYNQLGQKVLQEKLNVDRINVSKLGLGLYIIELVSNELTIRKRLVIR
jgi:hypothetical protein